MGKSKKALKPITSIPARQCMESAVGPIASLLLPCTTDLWHSPDSTNADDLPTTYFIYASKACFGMGRIRCSLQFKESRSNSIPLPEPHPKCVATLDHIEYIRDDYSRIVCSQFCRTSSTPLTVVLTDNGSLVFYDCLKRQTICRFSKSEIIDRITRATDEMNAESNGFNKTPKDKEEHANVRNEEEKNEDNKKNTNGSNTDNNDDEKEEGEVDDDDEDERPSKRFCHEQFINCICWPNSENAFLSVYFPHERSNFIMRLQLSSDFHYGDNPQVRKEGVKFIRYNLRSDDVDASICAMTTLEIDSGKTCVIAVGFEDGKIYVTKVNYRSGQEKRVIRRESPKPNAICSLVFWNDTSASSPVYHSGLLAAVSRDGFVTLWDVEYECYFAYYQIKTDTQRVTTSRNARNRNGRSNVMQDSSRTFDWFCANFVRPSYFHVPKAQAPHLAVSTSTGALTLFEIPKKVHGKRIKLESPSLKFNMGDSIRHSKIIFGMSSDFNNGILLTTSLDNNLIVWTCGPPPTPTLPSVQNQKVPQKIKISIKPAFLLPTMPPDARIHMLRFSPISNDRLALALGKAGLRFWKLPSTFDDLFGTRYDMQPGASMACRNLFHKQIIPMSIAWHPAREYRLAIGTFDGTIVRLDVMPDKFHIVMSSNKLSKEQTSGRQRIVTDLESEENFGAEIEPLVRPEDCVGNGNISMQPGAVYSICYGPDPRSSKDLEKSAIYSVSSRSGQMRIHVSDKSLATDPSKKASCLKNLLEILPKSCFEECLEFDGYLTEVSWNASHELMALGTKSGKVIIFKLVDTDGRIESDCSGVFKKYLVLKEPMIGSPTQCLAWHPSMIADSCFHNLLAVTMKDDPIIYLIGVIDGDFDTLAVPNQTSVKYHSGNAPVQNETSIEDHCNTLPVEKETSIENSANSNSEKPVSSRVTKLLKAHKRSVTDLQWSPHDVNKLASCSFDGTALIWDIQNLDGLEQTGTCSRFVARDKLFTIEWSIVDNDLVYTSGQHNAVLSWRPSKNTINEVAHSDTPSLAE